MKPQIELDPPGSAKEKKMSFQLKKPILISFLFLPIFCHASYSTVYAQIAAPRNLQLADDASIPTTCKRTFYVSRSGQNTANGLTPAAAWATIGKVNMTSFSPGDCILFKRGDTWNEQLRIPSSGSAIGGDITFGAYGTGNKPVFDGTGVALNTWDGLINSYQKSYILVSDIRVQDSGIGAANHNMGMQFYQGGNITVQRCEVYNTEDYGIFANGSSNVKYLHNDVSKATCGYNAEQISMHGVNGFEIAYNKSHDSCATAKTGGGIGIDAKGGSINGTIHHNEVYNLGTLYTNGIYVDPWDVSTYNVQIYNNYVHDVNGGGITVGNETTGNIHDITIHHNIVRNTSDAGLYMHDEGTTSGSVYNIYFYNNTLYLNGTSGQDWKGGVRIMDRFLATGGVTFKNNIFASAYNYQIGYYSSLVQPTDIIADYNVIYGINTGVYAYNSGTNTITSYPLFTNAAGGDFTLQSGSPAINACSNSVWQGKPNIVDYNGVAITDGSGNIVAPGGRVNCGAYE